MKNIGVGVDIAPMLAPVRAAGTRVTASPIVVAALDVGVAPVASMPALATAPVMLTSATWLQPCSC